MRPTIDATQRLHGADVVTEGHTPLGIIAEPVSAQSPPLEQDSHATAHAIEGPKKICPMAGSTSSLWRSLGQSVAWAVVGTWPRHAGYYQKGIYVCSTQGYPLPPGYLTVS